MKNMLAKHKINLLILLIVILDIILVILGKEVNAFASFITIPAIILINLAVIIYGFVRNKKKLGVFGIVSLIVTTIIAVMVFIENVVFLTR